MIIKLLLTFSLCLCGWYGLAQRTRSTAMSVFMLVVSIVGFYFIWFPDDATRIAQLVGVGRGTDLVLYLWVIISIAVGLNLHLELNRQLQLITRLTRHIAIVECQYGSRKSLDD